MIRSDRIHKFGDADFLRIEDIATGEPGAREVRLRVHAIGLNRTEVTLRSDRSPVKAALPSSIGRRRHPSALWRRHRGDRVALVPAYGAAQYTLYRELLRAASVSPSSCAS
jgi:hypothetical protein